jgi:hypothetical protein
MTASAMLLLVADRGLEAQAPHSRPRTSAVQQLHLDSARTPSVTGRMRELKCRGKPGIDMRIHQDPSPRQPDHVTMVLRYERLKVTYSSLRQVGMVNVDDGMSVQFQPGGCTWGGTPGDGFLTEPRIVYFDLPRDAQKHAAAGARDTTIEAAAHFADVASLPRYMSDSSRYWVFYVDDVTNVSISFGRWPLGGAPAPTHASVSGSLQDASPGSATLSSARVLPADSAARTPTVVRTPAPAPPPTGSVAGPLRDKAPGTATVAGARPLPTDSAARRTATVRTPTPTPTGSVAGPLRDNAPGSATPSTSRVMPTDTAAKLPEDARARSPRIADRRLANVRTAPGPLGVIITFDATGLPFFNVHNAVRVEIEFEPPAWDARERRWSYPTGLGGHWFARVTGGAGGLVAQPWTSLEPGRRYYYLITLFATDSLPEAQRTGSFTAEIRTPPQR